MLDQPPQLCDYTWFAGKCGTLVRSSQSMTCFLSDNATFSINQMQIKIISNFAMTDYCLQEKMHPVNPVDPMNYRSHQLYYTSLSCSASAEGMILLLISSQ